METTDTPARAELKPLAVLNIHPAIKFRFDTPKKVERRTQWKPLHSLQPTAIWVSGPYNVISRNHSHCLLGMVFHCPYSLHHWHLKNVLIA